MLVVARHTTMFISAVTTRYAVLALAAVAPGTGLLLGDADRRRRDVRPHYSGGSMRSDQEPRALEVVGD